MKIEINVCEVGLELTLYRTDVQLGWSILGYLDRGDRSPIATKNTHLKGYTYIAALCICFTDVSDICMGHVLTSLPHCVKNVFSKETDIYTLLR